MTDHILRRRSAVRLAVILLLAFTCLQGRSQQRPPIFLFSFGSAGQEYGKAIAVDNGGNVIVAGLFQGTVDFDPGPGTNILDNPAGVDMVIAKYDRLGRCLRAWNVSASGGVCVPHGVAVDASDNIYVAGYFGIEGGGSSTADFDPGPAAANLTATGGRDPFVAKYDSDGRYLWGRVFSNIPATPTEERAWDLAVDAAGSVYITGFLNGTIDLDATAAGTRLYTSQGGSDVFLVKYDASGNFVWGFGLGSIGDDEGLAVALDGANHIFLQGTFNNSMDLDPGPGVRLATSAGSTDLFIARFTTGGVFEGGITIGGAQPDLAAPGAMRADAAGDIFLAGRFRGTVDFDPGQSSVSFTNASGSDNIFVATYTGALALRWAFPIFSDGAGDGGHRIALDSHGAVWIAGWFAGTADFDSGPAVHNLTSRGTNGATDIFLARYDKDGNLLWVNGFGAPLSGSGNLSIAAGLALDQENSAYVTGQFFGEVDFDPSPASARLASVGMNDGFVAKYDAQGSLLPTLYFPTFSGDAARYTGIAVANWGSSNGKAAFTAYQNSGARLASPSSIVNPSTVDIRAGSQIARLGEELFKLSMGNPREGWIEAQFTMSEAAGFFLQGSTDLRYLDGGVAAGRTAVELYFTRAHVESGIFPGSGYRNVLNVVNPNNTPVRIDFRLLDDLGNVRAVATRNLNAKGRVAEEIGGLFPGAALTGGRGYVRSTANAGVIGYQSIEFGETILGLPAQETQVAADLISAQFASGVAGGIAYFTDINVINRSGVARLLRITLTGNDGKAVGSEVLRVLAAGQQERLRGETLFGLGDPSISPLRDGSLVIRVDGPGVIGDVVFGDPRAGRFLAGLPLDGRPASDILFSHVAEGGPAGSPPYFTGLAIYNPNERSVTVTIEVFSEAGQQTGTSTILLPSRNRLSRTLPELVPAVTSQIRGYIRLTSTGGPVVAFELFGDQTSDFLAAVPPQPILP